MDDFRARNLRSVAATTGLALAVLLAALALILTFAPPAGAGLDGTPTFTVTVTNSGNGGGIVRSEPAGIVCGSTCAVDFPSGHPVTLVAKSAHGSTFKGWDGTVKGGSKRLVIPSPSNGEPVTIEATFDKASRPTASFRGQFNPKEIKLRLGCGEAGPCRLRVTVTAAWLSKKGWDPHPAIRIVGSGSAGKRYTNVTVGLGGVGRRMAMFLKSHPGRKGAIKVVVEDIETGLRLAIHDKGRPWLGEHK